MLKDMLMRCKPGAVLTISTCVHSSIQRRPKNPKILFLCCYISINMKEATCNVVSILGAVRFLAFLDLGKYIFKIPEFLIDMEIHK
jgi:hypothetical protein